MDYYNINSIYYSYLCFLCDSFSKKDVQQTEKIYDLAYNVLSKSHILPSEEKELIGAILIPDCNEKNILALMGSHHGNLIIESANIEQVGNNWQICSIDTLLIRQSGGINWFKASDFHIPSFEMPKYIELNKTPYIFFMCREGNGGNAMPPAHGILYFALYNLRTKETVTLDFECSSFFDSDTEKVNGKFVKLDVTKLYPVEAKFLLKQAESSPYIYRPTADDLNLDLSRNAIKKWLKDNPEVTNLSDNDRAIIHFTYYDSDEYFKEIKHDARSITPTINYEVFYYWRGDVYGLDKKRNKYFVIYGNPDGYGAENVSWMDENTLKIETRGLEILIINLESGIVRCIACW